MSDAEYLRKIYKQFLISFDDITYYIVDTDCNKVYLETNKDYYKIEFDDDNNIMKFYVNGIIKTQIQFSLILRKSDESIFKFIEDIKSTF